MQNIGLIVILSMFAGVGVFFTAMATGVIQVAFGG